MTERDGPYKERIAVTEADDLANAAEVHRELYAAWLRSTPNETGLRAFNVDDLPGAALPHLAYLDVLDNGRDFRVRVVGAIPETVAGENFKGRLLSELPYPRHVLEILAGEHRWVTENRTPLYIRREGMDGRHWQDMTKLILPVSDGADGMRLVMSVFVLEFTDAAVDLGMDRKQRASAL